jgi:hypothetical protein
MITSVDKNPILTCVNFANLCMKTCTSRMTPFHEKSIVLSFQKIRLVMDINFFTCSWAFYVNIRSDSHKDLLRLHRSSSCGLHHNHRIADEEQVVYSRNFSTYLHSLSGTSDSALLSNTEIPPHI